MDAKSTAIAGALLLLLGCASAPSVRPQLADTNGALRAADEVGASELPQAALHLKLAKENARRAEGLVDDEPEAARRLLERAELDAELAIALVKESEARQELAHVNQELDELRGRLDQR